MYYHEESQVFLSYSHSDKRSAQEVYTRLRAKGINVWMDSAMLKPGEEWEKTIYNAMLTSTLVLVLLSKGSENPDGFFKEEIDFALDVWKTKPGRSVFLIPVRLEACAISKSLQAFHSVDLFARDGWQKLISQINEQVSKNKTQICNACGSDLDDASPKPRFVYTNHCVENDREKLIPIKTYPEDIERFVRDCVDWSQLSDETRRLLLTLGCKLEPIIQIVPTTPTSLILGFECLGLSALGESFPQIISRCDEIDPGLIRACLAIVAVKTVASLRFEAMQRGCHGARYLLFSINLDPFMVESLYFKKFLNWYYSDIAHNIIFEVKETVTRNCLQELKNLQADHDLRYAADDLGHWDDEIRSCLLDRVELTKMGHHSFVKAMEGRGENTEETLHRLLSHKVDRKPLIVEGIQDFDYLHFLERHWGCEFGNLYGQGYVFDSEPYWKSAIRPLKPYGLPGGSFLSQDAASH